MGSIAKEFFKGTEKFGLFLKRNLNSDRRWVRGLVDAVLLPSDLWKIRQAYRREFGSYPNIKRPKKFNEWLQWAKIHNRNDIQTVMADKVASRNFIEEAVGPDMVVHPIWVGRDIRSAPFEDLPDEFVVKPSQGSGQILVIRDKSLIDVDYLSEKTAGWLESDHSVHFAEWQYRWMDRLIIIEPFLRGRHYGRQVEFSFWCFAGVCKLVCVNIDVKTRSHRRAYFDRELNPVDLSVRFESFRGGYDFPEEIFDMMEVAEKVSKHSMFVRVDFFDTNPPVIGELTLTPGAGLRSFYPEFWNDELGGFIESSQHVLRR